MTEDSPRRRWVLVATVLLLIVFALPLVSYLYVRWQGNAELARVRAELDEAEPGWRLPDLVAARNARLAGLPVNSADTVTATFKLLPEKWDQPLGPNSVFADSPPNRQPTAVHAGRLRAVHAATAAARRSALALRDQPDGGSPLVIPDYTKYAVNINLTPVQERRVTASLLNVITAVAALDGDPTTAVSANRAGVNVARSVGDEPLLISQLVRVACLAVAVRAAEVTLGLCEPSDGLSELQAAFEREAGERHMRAGLLGELASVDQMMTNIRAGTAGPAAGGSVGMSLNPYWPHDHAAGLRLLKAHVDDAGQPPHTRQSAAAAERALLAEPPFKTGMSRLLAPAASKVLEADARTQAQLLTAAVGLACERHRRVTGRWPATLTDLHPGLLVSVPADPFDGRPLRYKLTADGGVVYSIGQNRTDDGGTPPAADDRAGGDVVFRLYDPDKRKLPALPPAPDAAP